MKNRICLAKVGFDANACHSRMLLAGIHIQSWMPDKNIRA
jgi:hypothetical protein